MTFVFSIVCRLVGGSPRPPTKHQKQKTDNDFVPYLLHSTSFVWYWLAADKLLATLIKYLDLIPNTIGLDIVESKVLFLFRFFSRFFTGRPRSGSLSKIIELSKMASQQTTQTFYFLRAKLGVVRIRKKNSTHEQTDFFVSEYRKRKKKSAVASGSVSAWHRREGGKSFARMGPILLRPVLCSMRHKCAPSVFQGLEAHTHAPHSHTHTHVNSSSSSAHGGVYTVSGHCVSLSQCLPRTCNAIGKWRLWTCFFIWRSLLFFVGQSFFLWSFRFLEIIRAQTLSCRERVCKCSL